MILAAFVSPLAAQEDVLTITGGTMFDLFLRGGVLMWPILLCSIVALTFILERFVGLRSSVIFPQHLLSRVKELIRTGATDEAEALCKTDRSPFAQLLHGCLKRPCTDVAGTEAALEETGSRLLYDMRKNTRPLGVIADVSPILGLMGTVLGMIKSFEVVATAGPLHRAEKLAHGIAEALFTTGFGLVVAVPAIIFYHYFRGKAEGLLRSMEDTCLDLLDDLPQQEDNG